MSDATCHISDALSGIAVRMSGIATKWGKNGATPSVSFWLRTAYRAETAWLGRIRRAAPID
jgi:hypothetical protein